MHGIRSSLGWRRPRRAWIVALLAGASLQACFLLFPAGKAACGGIFLLGLIAAACVDFDSMVIPDLFTVGLAMVGIALSFAVPGLHGTCAYSLLGCLRSGAAAILGLALGSALGLWMALLGELFLGREVLGFGDVKFLGAIGAFCGWQGAIFSVFGGAMIGAVALGAAGLHRRVAGPGARPILRLELPGEAGCGPAWQAQFPFGPMLAAAGAVYFVAPHAWVDRLLAHYQALF